MRSLRTLGLFVAMVAGAGTLTAADDGKMHYTSEWTKLDDPAAKGRQMVIVVHNTPQGEHRMVVKFVLGEGFPVGQSVKLKDGTMVDVTFIQPPRGTNILKQPVRIKSVMWDGVAVPPKPAVDAKAENPKKGQNDPENEKAKSEERATSFLRYAKKLLDSGMTDKAKERLQEIVEKLPGTKAAEEAKGLLEKLRKK